MGLGKLFGNVLGLDKLFGGPDAGAKPKKSNPKSRQRDSVGDRAAGEGFSNPSAELKELKSVLKQQRDNLPPKVTDALVNAGIDLDATVEMVKPEAPKPSGDSGEDAAMEAILKSLAQPEVVDQKPKQEAGADDGLADLMKLFASMPAEEPKAEPKAEEKKPEATKGDENLEGQVAELEKAVSGLDELLKTFEATAGPGQEAGSKPEAKAEKKVEKKPAASDDLSEKAIMEALQPLIEGDGKAEKKPVAKKEVTKAKPNDGDELDLGKLFSSILAAA